MEQLRLPSLGLFRRLAGHGHRPAIVTPQTRTSYRDLLRASSRLAQRLGPPAKPHAFRPIALLAPRDASYCVGQLGIFQAAGAYVPLHPRLPPAEARYLLEDCGCRQAVVHPSLRATVEGELRALGVELVELPPPPPDVEGGETGGGGKAGDEAVEFSNDGLVTPGTDAMVVYTSGTTGRPKGVVKTHAQLEGMIASLVEAWGYAPTDRILHLLPLHHLHGVVNKLLCVLSAGGVVEFPGEGQTKPRDILRRLAASSSLGDDDDKDKKERFSLFMAVPTIYQSLMEELEAAPGLDAATKEAALDHFRQMRLMVSGSAALPQSLFAKWEQRTGHRLLERYGTTEAGFIFSNPLHGGPRLPGYVGQPLPGVEARLVDPATEQEVGPSLEGEVRVKGPQLFDRYHGRPEATREAFDADGWYKTGDLAVWDAAKGSHRILGRLSADIIKSGGYKISALDIEAAILEALPRVAEAVVVGRPHAKWGEEIVAIVRLADGGQGEADARGLSLEELQAALKPHLAPYKLPRALLVVQAIPKNAMGKTNKKTVWQELEGGKAGSSVK